MAITKVYLLSVPLEKDYSHTLWFSTWDEQYDYFIGQKKAEYSYEDFTYQRKDGVIRVPAQIDTLWRLGVNYVMYQNTAYDEKWFYAFVTDMKYVNDGNTNLTIQTDCLQTWMFEKTVMPCFVEREHTGSDTVGINTIPEGLETGEYICNLHSMSDYGGDSKIIVIGVTENPDGDNLRGNMYGGIYSGITYYGFDNEDTTGIDEFIASYADGHTDAIVCMFVAPYRVAPARLDSDHVIAGSNLIGEGRLFINSSSDTDEGGKVEKTITKGTLDGYTPRNKKLLTFPYRYLLVSNNAGGAVTYKYEAFKENGEIRTPAFVIEGVLTPGCSIRMVPLYYNGAYRNDEEGVNMGKYPIVNWTSDVYTNWLTQNGVNIGLEIVSGIGQIVAGTAIAVGSGGIGTAVGGGSIVSGVSQIAGTLSQVHSQSFTPPQAKGNLNCGDVVTSTNKNDFHFYDMTVKGEYAKLLDEYFDMYGYKTHRVKVPNENHRESYWFTKTIDANITGPIPQEDLQILKDCYNRGVTYWKDPSNFKNYGATNDVIPLCIISQSGETPTFLEGSDTALNVIASGIGLSYQWKLSIPDGWLDLTEESAKTAKYRFTATKSMDGNIYKCTVTDYYGNSVDTHWMTVNVI